MPRFSALAVAVMSSLAISAAASSAVASSAGAPAPPGCFVSVGTGTSLPSNAPALLFTDNSHGGAAATVTAELVTGDARVAFVGPTKDTHGLTILQFANPPSVGTHTIETKVGCSNGEDKTEETPLVLTAPVPFPKSVGTLTVKPSSPPKGTDEIILEPSPELRAFFPVSSVKMLVNDDVRSAALGYAEQGTSGVKFTAHTGSVCVENGALHREKRTVKVTVMAHIAGLAESPAPAVIDVPVDCGAIKWTSNNDYKGSKDSTTTTTPVTGDGDADSASASTGGVDGGCSAAPTGVASGNAAALVAGAVAVLAGLRRRRSRS